MVHVTDVTSRAGNALEVKDWNVDNTAGYVHIVAWDANAAHSGDIVFADVTYRSVGNQLSSTTLDINVGDMTDYYNYSQIEHNVSNGVFKIGEVDDDTPRNFFKNIAVREVIGQNITRGSTVIYQFKKDANSINFVKFDAKTDAGYITIIVEILKDISSSVSTAPTGEVYKYIDIRFGKAGYATDENIADPVIGFKVARSWLDKYNIDKSTIQLNQYTPDEWKPLSTTNIREDSKYLYFESKTNGFSSFAITGTVAKAGGEGVITESVEDVEDVSGQATEQAASENMFGLPGFGLLTGLSIMLIAVRLLHEKK